MKCILVINLFSFIIKVVNKVGKSSFMKIIFCVFISLLIMSCSSNRGNEVVDLNKVLDVFASTMDEKDIKQVAAADITEETPEAQNFKQISAAEESKADLDDFITDFSINLNKAKLASFPIAVNYTGSGAIQGYRDNNSNFKKDSGERALFLIEVDNERSRIVATDTQNGYHRDYSYRSRWHGGGFFTGMFLGSMMGRQSRSGIFSSRFSNMKMSSKNYYSGAVSKAKSSWKSSSRRARSSGGSRSFSRGK